MYHYKNINIQKNLLNFIYSYPIPPLIVAKN